MPTTLTAKLRDEYQKLFDSCALRDAKAQEVERTVGQIQDGQSRYATVGEPLGIPWFFIGLVHCLEASLSFKTHLHNGDPLTRRTVQVPAGRPTQGEPPFTWEESATDALRMRKLHLATDWGLPSFLFKLEGYNGFGYRSRGIPSPYLWSFSNHYTRGKFVADGTFSETAVSKQCGGATLLRRMAEKGVIRFDTTGTLLSGSAADEAANPAAADLDPMVPFAPDVRTDLAEELQRALNRFPGIFLKADGKAGEKTSDAFKRVTGHFLHGDPREAAG